MINDRLLLARWYQPTLNWGDALNPYLIEKLSRKKVVNVLHSKYNFWKVVQRLGVSKKSEHLVIGSILSWGHYRAGVAEIWGPGFMSADDELKFKPKAIHAVRGELSRALLIRQGFSCPKVYGDPALIMPCIYRPKIKKQSGLIGFIPHYVDKEKFSKSDLDKHEGIKFIDIEQEIEPFVDELLECSVVISSSLHGLIAADAYGIPSHRIAVSDKISGGDFKFKDYYSGIGSDYTPASTVGSIDCLYSAAGKCEKNNVSEDMISSLVKSCPFLSPKSLLSNF